MIFTLFPNMTSGLIFVLNYHIRASISLSIFLLDVEYTLISVGPYQNFCPEGTEPIYSEKQCKDLAMDCQERESPRCKVKFSNLKQESGDQIGKDIDGLTWKYSGSRRGSTKGCQIWLHQNRGYIYFNTHKTGGVPKSASAPRDRLCLKGKN